jgi:hypothetical protein
MIKRTSRVVKDTVCVVYCDFEGQATWQDGNSFKSYFCFCHQVMGLNGCSDDYSFVVHFLKTIIQLHCVA